MKTLFISRSIQQNGELAAFCRTQHIHLIAESLIFFELVEANDFPFTDVLFFTSPRSVDFFLKQAIIREHQLLATVGAGTTAALEQRGFKVHFTGATPSQPHLVAREFNTWLNGRTVLFPQSDRSNQTMQKQLKADQVVNRIVYRTVLVKKEITPKPDMLIFSSPSNVDAFLLANSLSFNQRVIAFGTTTAAFLEKNGIACDQLSDTSESEIVRFLKKLIS
jgi:uroporphyrinogen-III synthase